MAPPFLSPTPSGCVLRVRVVPRAGRSSLSGERGGALLVRLAAAPVDGTANEALLTFLAKCLDVPRRSLQLTSGERSRDKRVTVTGLSVEAAAARLALRPGQR